ncbi:FAD-binding oxidoreductase [Mesorhizobium sp.]|uniref:NAD(P)/FAD-dependent oxidoreductase n=1 Tax=Mesorhizobium sp. TaxID=1871066 RepID=UPI0025FE19AA|nr:FAD-binding oxidoreductase [Mesorhizobium sp.]
MPAPLKIVQSSQTVPKSADTVVIGAGIVGVSTAYWLARAGQSVVLVEKGSVGAEQSSRNWGWCRQQNRDARELPLSTKSLSLWEEMAADIGDDMGFSRCGLLYLSDAEAEIETWAKWGRFARGEGVVTQMLGSGEASVKGSATGKTWKGGVWSPTDGTADPSRAAPAVARGIMKHNGIVLQNCAARGIEHEAGAVSGVITERGVIRTQNVVLAGGAWASSFLRQLDIAFPQAAIRSSILSVAPGAQGLPAALHTSRVSVTRRSDGAYTLAVSGFGKVDPTPGAIYGARHFVPMFAKRWRMLSPGGLQAWNAGFETRRRWKMDQPTPMEAVRILDPRPSRRHLDLILARARTLLPELSKVAVQAEWAGYIDSTPDGVPVIDGDIGLRGLVLAAGFSGHGFGIGPGAGHLAADIVLGRKPITQVSQYRLSRFAKTQWGKVSEY